MVVPTYNERDRIAELTRTLFAACAQHGVELELVIVDDNSPDGTGAIADELAREHNVTVIHRAGKLGWAQRSWKALTRRRQRSLASWMRTSATRLRWFHGSWRRSEPRRQMSSLPAAMYPAAARRTGRSVAGCSRASACLLARPLTPIRDAASGFFVIRRRDCPGRAHPGGRLQNLPRAARARLAAAARRAPVSVRRSRAWREQDEPPRGRRIPRAAARSLLVAIDGWWPTSRAAIGNSPSGESNR